MEITKKTSVTIETHKTKKCSSNCSFRTTYIDAYCTIFKKKLKDDQSKYDTHSLRCKECLTVFGVEK